MIKKCGQVESRGRIRRVWRSRYLELSESGMLHYYEVMKNSLDCLPGDTKAKSSLENGWYNISKIKAASSRLLSAHQPCSNTSDAANSFDSGRLPSTALHDPNCELQSREPEDNPRSKTSNGTGDTSNQSATYNNDNNHNNHNSKSETVLSVQHSATPKMILKVSKARLLQTETRDAVVCGRLPFNCTAGFVFYATESAPSLSALSPNDGGTESSTTAAAYSSRPFYCAVKSKREAMEWVKALRESAQDNHDIIDDKSIGDQEQMGLKDHGHGAFSSSTSLSSFGSLSGVTVVSVKVCNVHLSKVGLLYEIRFLVCSLPDDQSDDDDDTDQLCLEEWIVFKPLSHFTQLLHDLTKDSDLIHSHNNVDQSGPQNDPQSSPLTSPLSVLQKAQSEFVQVCHPSDNEKQKAANNLWNCLFHQREASLQTMLTLQGILQRFTISQQIRNSSSIKYFFMLEEGTTQPQKTIIFNRATQENVHQYVAQWLTLHHSDGSCYRHLCSFWNQEFSDCENFWMLALVSLALLLLYSLLRLSLPVLSLRSDAFIFTLALAFIVGRDTASKHDTTVLVPVGPVPPPPTILQQTDQRGKSIQLTDDDQSTTNIKQTPILDRTVPPTPLLPEYSSQNPTTSWSEPQSSLFNVRSATYFQNKLKLPSAPAPFQCRGVDIFLTSNPKRNISKQEKYFCLNGTLPQKDTFMVNILLPFANCVAYFSIPPKDQMASNVAHIWEKFQQGDDSYRNARLKMLPLVLEGPWIVKVVAPSNSPALLGSLVPMEYYFTPSLSSSNTSSNNKDIANNNCKGVYEVDAIMSNSRIVNGILDVVKGHAKNLSIGFAFIIEASEEEELPETVLCTFALHQIHFEHCASIPDDE